MAVKTAKKLLPLLIIAALFTTLYTTHARSDWSVTGSAAIAPQTAWANCYQATIPGLPGEQQPGISPRSKLYYHPKVAYTPSGEKTWNGWLFYGHITTEQGQKVEFSCDTDTSGQRIVL